MVGWNRSHDERQSVHGSSSLGQQQQLEPEEQLEDRIERQQPLCVDRRCGDSCLRKRIADCRPGEGRGYLSNKWGVSINSSHTYATTPPSTRYVAYIGTPVSLQVEATQGPESYAAGSILASKGLNINTSTGLITGTPNSVGDFNSTVTVSNSSGSQTKSFYFSVLKGTRVLDWNQTIAGLAYGNSPFDLNASSTGSGGITYASSDESILELNGTTRPQFTLEAGLVRYWDFDNDQNGTSNPVTGKIGGINGTKGSGVTVMPGKFGNALKFDGSSNANSKVDFGTGAGDMGKNLTVSLWVKRLVDASGRIISNKNGTGNQAGWELFVTTNDKNLYAKVNNQQRQVTGVNDWRDAQWHHAVMTVSDQSSNNYRLYADGTLKNQNTMPALSNGSASLKLGIEGDGSGQPAQGHDRRRPHLQPRFDLGRSGHPVRRRKR